MDIVRRKYKGKKVEFKVYKEQEAKKLGLKVVYWQDAQLGDWALTDDGWAVEVLSVSYYTSAKRKVPQKYMVFSVGTMFVSKYAKLNYEIRRQNKAYSEVSELEWYKKVVKKTRSKVAIKYFANMLYKGLPIDYNSLGRILWSGHRFARKDAQKFFKIEEVQVKVGEELVKALAKNNYDAEWVVKETASIVEAAKKTGKLEIALKGVTEIGKYLRLYEESTNANKAEVNYHLMLESVQPNSSIEEADVISSDL